MMLTTDMCNVLYFYFAMAVLNLEYQYMCTLERRNEELYPPRLQSNKVVTVDESENMEYYIHCQTILPYFTSLQ